MYRNGRGITREWKQDAFLRQSWAVLEAYQSSLIDVLEDRGLLGLEDGHAFGDFASVRDFAE